MEKYDPMMEAMKNKRAKVLDIKVMMGGEGEEKEMGEKSDMAPPMVEEKDDSAKYDEEMASSMSDYDKEQVMNSDKPKSLGMAAKKAMLERMKMKG